MSDPSRWTLGAQVNCTDGNCGEVHALVVGPAGQLGPEGARLTHLVVEPEGRIGLGRLVAMELVESSGAVVELSCSLNAFGSLPVAEESDVVKDLGAAYVLPKGAGLLRRAIREVLPEGETGLQTATPVLATDGHIGVAYGLLTTPEDYAITSVVVSEERLLWGHKIFAIPISAVASFADGVELNLGMADVGQVAVGMRH
ncbi:MAG TPA: hypothetical protein VEJ84_13060 [Acidimicrobiales bacterium]|nr:hypothetical protein [Acidimicrobiales bacterium]